MEKVLLVQTTFSDRNEATAFSTKVLQARLAACVQLSGDVESMYWWKESIEKDKEIIVTMKTLHSVYQRLVAFIEQTHSYETPEILATAVEHVGAGYFQWICEEIITKQDNNE